MKNLKSKRLLVFLAVFYFISPLSLLNKAQATSASELQALIDALQRQIAQMQAQSPAIYRFERNLYFGLKNDDDVRRLQNYLISKRLLSATSSTGNFFTLTLEAVKKYQASVGISATGYFGPLTRAKVNAELELLRQSTPLPGAPPATSDGQIPIAEKQEPVPVTESPPAPSAPSSGIDSAHAYSLDRIALLVQEYVNKERWSNGLAILIWDDSLARVAELHSLDQATDNGEITNPDIYCHYPMIRHEGIRGGYSLSDRLHDGGISYRAAGENIVMFSTGKNFVFQYPSNDPPQDCKEVPRFTPGEGTKEERLSLFYSILNMALEAVRGLKSVDWVHKEWMIEDEIARKAVDLWMNSEGHRANILRGYFNYAGIGISKVNDYLIITQNFAWK